MEEERDVEEMSEEEEPSTQRFSVVVVWSPESGQRMDPGEVQSVLHDAIMELDDEAVVQVTEINEPAY